ncbi:hypothetical protein PAPHI01_0381 [Pancytospora philotis]|nr:hypothetical protein PAPHI01_0355 [Pancytospora philotis]KAI4291107.1 hypothetical protein PAPHI01_0381 [Pancytospora philotis]
MDPSYVQSGSEDRITQLRLEILAFCASRRVEVCDFPPLVYSMYERIFDHPIEDWIRVAVPLLQAYCLERSDPAAALDSLKQFMTDAIELRAIEKELFQIYRRLKFDKHDRADTRIINRYIKGFRCEYTDWENQFWLLELISYLFCRAMQMYTHLSREEAVQWLHRTAPDAPTPDARPTEYFKIEPCLHKRPFSLKYGGVLGLAPTELIERPELLKRTGGPTMSLDEYADKVVDQMRKLENERAAQTELSDVESAETDSAERAALIAQDEVNDQKRCNLGNTYKQG